MGHIYLYRKRDTFVTKLFRQTNFKIGYRVDKSIEHILKCKNQNVTKYLAIEVYKLSCLFCGKPT